MKKHYQLRNYRFQDAEDCVQEIFCVVWQICCRASQIEDSTKLLSYVGVAVFHRVNNFIRRGNRMAHHQLTELAAAQAPARTPDGLSSDDKEAIREKVELLPPMQREIIRRRFYLEQDVAEISEAMGFSRGTYLRRYHDALATMAKLLGVNSGKGAFGDTHVPQRIWDDDRVFVQRQDRIERERRAFNRFLAKCCEVGEGFRVKANSLWDAFQSFDGREVELTRRKFGSLLASKFERGGRGNEWYRGLHLKNETAPASTRADV